MLLNSKEGPYKQILEARSSSSKRNSLTNYAIDPEIMFPTELESMIRGKYAELVEQDEAIRKEIMRDFEEFIRDLQLWNESMSLIDLQRGEKRIDLGIQWIRSRHQELEMSRNNLQTCADVVKTMLGVLGK